VKKKRKIMEKLLEGIVEFKRKDFEKHKELFRDLGRKQNPHTLFIGCSDSRIDPTLITKTLPGELFLVRNLANIIPVYRESNEFLSTTSAIEYAVNILNIKNIVICGHSNCAGCASLYLPPEAFKKIPHTKKWLELALNVKEKVLKQIPDEDLYAREWLTEQINIVEQIKHLLSYPFIREKYKNKEMNIYGWYYIIETGEIFNYNKEKKYFELVN
jgi:carbonic anhydrase